MIAIVLVGILSSVVVVGVGQLTNRGSTASCAASQDAARAAATVHFGSTGSYPTTFTQMTGGSPPALTLPSGATVNGTGDLVTVGSWSLRLTPGSGSTAPTFTCLDGTLWTPTQLTGLAMWFDASDVASLTIASGQVSEWRDLSVNGRHVTQADAARRPSSGSATQNGRNLVTFDGANDFLARSASVSVPAELTVAVVAKPSTGTEDYLFQMTNSSNQQWAVISKYSGLSYEFYRLGAARFTLGPPAATGLNAVVLTQDATQITSTVNGTPSGSATVASAPRTIGTVVVGAAELDGEGAAGTDMGEVVVSFTTLSTLDRQRLEGYLAHKWGLAGSLPANHPFKSAPPTV